MLTGFLNSCIAITIIIILKIDLTYAGDFNIGSLTQAQGKITFLHFAPPHKLENVKLNDTIKTGGSYLSYGQSNLTIKLLGGAWLRASVRTKFWFEYDPEAKILVINLMTGSVKIFFSSFLGEQKLKKVIVNSANGVFETVEGKFSVIRNNLTEENTLIVEKGTVSSSLQALSAPNPSLPVHSNEMMVIHNRQKTLIGPRPLEPREIKFLKSNFYIGGKEES